MLQDNEKAALWNGLVGLSENPSQLQFLQVQMALQLQSVHVQVELHGTFFEFLLIVFVFILFLFLIMQKNVVCVGGLHPTWKAYLQSEGICLS